MSCLTRRWKAKTFYETVLIVEFVEVLKCSDRFRDRFEVAHPHQLFLQCLQEAFNTAVVFLFTDEGRRRFDAQETVS